MFRLNFDRRSDALRHWELPDKIFFACGACHILAYAFLERYDTLSAQALWVRPATGFTGNHIVVAYGDRIFDYHGYSNRGHFIEHTFRKAELWWPGWEADLIPLPSDVLISEAKSRTYDRLWLREPRQFPFDALPRARAFVARLPAPV